MKTILIGLSVLALGGCVPSLCLFNCGTATPQRPQPVEDRHTFIQNGIQWRCVLGNDYIDEYTMLRAKSAVCFEVKP